MDAPTNWSQSWEREVRGTAPRRHQRSEGSARDSVERPVHGPVAGPNWALSLLRVETEKGCGVSNDPVHQLAPSIT